MSHAMFAGNLPGRWQRSARGALDLESALRAKKAKSLKATLVEDNKVWMEDANRTPQVGSLVETIQKKQEVDSTESLSSQIRRWLVALFEEELEEDEDQERCLDICMASGVLRVPCLRGDTIAELLPRAAAVAAELGYASGLQVQVRPPSDAEVLVGSAIEDLPEGTTWMLSPANGAFDSPCSDSNNDNEGSAVFVHDPLLGPAVRITGTKGLEEFLVTWSF
jgi:hypothetical protein